MSQIVFQEALSRIGMQVRGGNLIDVPWSTVADSESVGNVAWVGRDMGIFVVDWADSKIVELNALAGKDVIVCSAVLNQDGARTDFVVGDRRFDAKGADMTMVFVPQREHFQFGTSVSRGLKAVTVVVDVMSMMETRGLPDAALPKSLLRMIRGRQIAMETLAPGHFGAIARDVAARRAMFPSLAALYYEAKTFELVSALLNEFSRRDAFRAGDGAFDPGILDRLDRVKRIIDRAPRRIIDVDALSRVAAMNRTKLRSAFKQVYGTTLSGYRTGLMLQRADRALKQGGASVKQAARHAGYATASSFIVAYKRQYGVCPGIVLRD
ncbi:helix-turn-helix transcriptional regulator [Bradyrhizobium sp. BRP22]|uniref:helix-turn-helix transcriptional regulator n=1 Tax=Bradyrhizobium sp. BRP22 TaxID=2793821 RepID=UPI001CD65E2E|nr:AraC family transcriptional regulator [Bradyrhizobium sp. BRP22]MCA1457653.1 helix-turn-helix transcriptional regulator [Bradyrhizobium sp. BRP22]